MTNSVPRPLPGVRERFAGLDACRGLIMVGMSLDHAVYLLWRLRAAPLVIVAVTLAVLPELAAPYCRDTSEHLPLAVALLLLPGKSCGLVTYFVSLPWLGICLGGLLLGRVLAGSPRRGLLLAAGLGAGLFASALFLRWRAGFGNLGLVEDHGWAGTLSFVRYGPSLVYIGWNAGLVLLSWPMLCWAGRRIPVVLRPWCVLGGSPLLFYVGHLALFGTLAHLIGPARLALGTALLAWFLGLVLLWPLCRWYANFKRETPADSVWRLF